MGNLSRAIRFDRASIGSANWDRTAPGFIRAWGNLAAPGVKTYRNPDGSVRRELMPPEELANPDYLASLGGIPVTLEHPPSMLTPSTVREHQRGSTGTEINYDSGFVRGVVVITDEDAIQAASRGDAAELSVGFSCQIDETPGVWQGQPYDAVQRRPRGNHLALTRQARVGPDVRLDGAAPDEDEVARMDGTTPAEAINFSEPVSTPPTTRPIRDDSMARSTKKSSPSSEPGQEWQQDGSGHEKESPVMDMDGEEEMDYDDEEDDDMKGGRKDCNGSKRRDRGDSADVPRSEYNRVVAELERQTGVNVALEARLDSLEEEMDQLEAEASSRTDSGDDKGLNEKVQERLDLLSRAMQLSGQRFDSFRDCATDREIQIAAIVARGGNPERFDGMSDEAVQSAFDTYEEITAPRGNRRSEFYSSRQDGNAQDLIDDLGGAGSASSRTDGLEIGEIILRRQQAAFFGNKPPTD